MQNSQYSNQFNIHINELCRITFNEVRGNAENQEVLTEIVTISLMADGAKVLANAILETLEKHKENQKNALKTTN